MKAPSLPPGETQRLRALQSLPLLDTPGDERFDAITRMAQRLLSVPIALVSVVDEDRQWFKSRQGLEIAETPREVSFCGHAILQDGLFIVEDAAADERFRDNPLVCGAPHIRFYAGYVLRAVGGQRLGTLCIIDRKPRDFTPAERELLADLGKLAEQQLGALAFAATDPLTGIPNRGSFYILAQSALASCGRLGQVVTVALFDLDGLRRINDQQGHEAGDQCLVEFARCLRHSCRESDVVGRLGGDEFAMLLPNTLGPGGAQVIRRLDLQLRDAARRGVAPVLAYSVGMTEQDPVSRPALDGLISAASQDLLAAKQQTRARAGAGSATAPKHAVLVPPRAAPARGQGRGPI